MKWEPKNPRALYGTLIFAEEAEDDGFLLKATTLRRRVLRELYADADASPLPDHLVSKAARGAYWSLLGRAYDQFHTWRARLT